MDYGAHEQRPFSLPEGATEIIVVRHGAAEIALPGARFPLVDGRGDPNLSEDGHEQARAIADLLAPEGIKQLFVTPLRRTHQTAAPLVGVTGLELTGPDAVAVAILHGGVIGEVCRQATGSRPFAFVHSDNGSVSRLVIRPSGRWLLRSFNEVSHLSARTGPSG